MLQLYLVLDKQQSPARPPPRRIATLPASFFADENGVVSNSVQNPSTSASTSDATTKINAKSKSSVSNPNLRSSAGISSTTKIDTKKRETELGSSMTTNKTTLDALISPKNSPEKKKPKKKDGGTEGDKKKLTSSSNSPKKKVGSSKTTQKDEENHKSSPTRSKSQRKEKTIKRSTENGAKVTPLNIQLENPVSASLTSPKKVVVVEPGQKGETPQKSPRKQVTQIVQSSPRSPRSNIQPVPTMNSAPPPKNDNPSTPTDGKAETTGITRKPTLNGLLEDIINEHKDQEHQKQQKYAREKEEETTKKHDGGIIDKMVENSARKTSGAQRGPALSLVYSNGLVTEIDGGQHTNTNGNSQKSKKLDDDSEFKSDSSSDDSFLEDDDDEKKPEEKSPKMKQSPSSHAIVVQPQRQLQPKQRQSTPAFVQRNVIQMTPTGPKSPLSFSTSSRLSPYSPPSSPSPSSSPSPQRSKSIAQLQFLPKQRASIIEDDDDEDDVVHEKIVKNTNFVKKENDIYNISGSQNNSQNTRNSKFVDRRKHRRSRSNVETTVTSGQWGESGTTSPTKKSNDKNGNPPTSPKQETEVPAVNQPILTETPGKGPSVTSPKQERRRETILDELIQLSSSSSSSKDLKNSSDKNVSEKNVSEKKPREKSLDDIISQQNPGTISTTQNTDKKKREISLDELITKQTQPHVGNSISGKEKSSDSIPTKSQKSVGAKKGSDIENKVPVSPGQHSPPHRHVRRVSKISNSADAHPPRDTNARETNGRETNGREANAHRDNEEESEFEIPEGESEPRKKRPSTTARVVVDDGNVWTEFDEKRLLNLNEELRILSAKISALESGSPSSSPNTKTINMIKGLQDWKMNVVISK